MGENLNDPRPHQGDQVSDIEKQLDPIISPKMPPLDPTKKEIKPCTHDILERSEAWVDGYCSFCQSESISRLTSLLEEKERELCLLETLVGTLESRLKAAEESLEKIKVWYVECAKSALALIRGEK